MAGYFRFRRYSGHGRACCWLDPVADDPLPEAVPTRALCVEAFVESAGLRESVVGRATPDVPCLPVERGAGASQAATGWTEKNNRGCSKKNILRDLFVP
jgi:hypothetical protein